MFLLDVLQPKIHRGRCHGGNLIPITYLLVPYQPFWEPSQKHYNSICHRNDCELNLKLCCFHWPGFGLVSSHASRIVSSVRPFCLSCDSSCHSGPIWPGRICHGVMSLHVQAPTIRKDSHKQIWTNQDMDGYICILQNDFVNRECADFAGEGLSLRGLKSIS